MNDISWSGRAQEGGLYKSNGETLETLYVILISDLVHVDVNAHCYLFYFCCSILWFIYCFSGKLYIVEIYLYVLVCSSENLIRLISARVQCKSNTVSNSGIIFILHLESCLEQPLPVLMFSVIVFVTRHEFFLLEEYRFEHGSG